MASSQDLSGAQIVELMGQPKGRPISFNCIDEETIHKNTILKFSGAATDKLIAASSAHNDFFAGVANAEKKDGDGSTTLSGNTCGIYKMLCNGLAIAIGSKVAISGANAIKVADDDNAADFQKVIGTALGTASAGTAKYIPVAIGVY